MRAEFIHGLADLADRDPRVLLLTADLGFGVVETFRDRHPSRFVNVGVTEQAMIGVATGLAEAGWIPYCYSIASFAVARTFEFLRNGPVAHRLPVRLIGVGPGLDYSFDGFTHYALEDVGMLLPQPNTRIVMPSTALSAQRFAQAGDDLQGLVYYRLARSTPDLPPTLDGEQVAGSSVRVVGVGDAVHEAARIADGLSHHQIDAAVTALEVLTMEELDHLVARIIDADDSVVVCVEHHYSLGGVGTFLADRLLARGWQGRFVKHGIDEAPLGLVGSPSFVRSHYMTDSDAIVAAILDGLDDSAASSR